MNQPVVWMGKTYFVSAIKESWPYASAICLRDPAHFALCAMDKHFGGHQVELNLPRTEDVECPTERHAKIEWTFTHRLGSWWWEQNADKYGPPPQTVEEAVCKLQAHWHKLGPKRVVGGNPYLYDLQPADEWQAEAARQAADAEMERLEAEKAESEAKDMARRIVLRVLNPLHFMCKHARFWHRNPRKTPED